ncbi:MAG: DUF4238 domain-containing protein, partial [Lachnospiraceae bacterium]|nr:DUF4238 domain-containing protein [Lachnospiraceae bacterium]
MKNHYIPRLLLRQFSHGEKINTYDFINRAFQTKKLKNTFAQTDLFDEQLEKEFAYRIEGPVGDLLNNRLIVGNTITLERRENLLLRKFLMINFLRAPIVNCTWEEMVERTHLEDHPSIRVGSFFRKYSPEFRKLFDEGIPSKNTYIRDLRIAMEYDSLMDISNIEKADKIPLPLQNAANLSLIRCIAFWDCEDSGQEFILPKLPGISMMDFVGPLYKWRVIKE